MHVNFLLLPISIITTFKWLSGAVATLQWKTFEHAAASNNVQIVNICIERQRGREAKKTNKYFNLNHFQCVLQFQWFRTHWKRAHWKKMIKHNKWTIQRTVCLSAGAYSHSRMHTFTERWQDTHGSVLSSQWIMHSIRSNLWLCMCARVNTHMLVWRIAEMLSLSMGSCGPTEHKMFSVLFYSPLRSFTASRLSSSQKRFNESDDGKNLV